ncbi:histidine kinase [Hymenobacter sp. HMF4947]|uniref:Histidine kinase n=1 Tax=Hymenobacter ginkgonis TaxID=2682976 RepID=A0A7K1TDT1_9BACT|nr:sensor histidine kinase [Hymenobacter ginkgonis]MVN76524.1 histidine kinase [Hymenobacter ginkgonis]
MNRSRIILYQALCWALIIGYDLVFHILTAKPNPKLSLGKELLLQFTFGLATMSLFYYCYVFVFPRGLRQWPLLVLGLLGTPLVFAGSRYLLQEVLLPFFFGFHNYYPGTTLSYYLIDNAYYLPPTIVLAGAAVLVRDAFVREKERENQLLLQVLEQEKTQAELAFLRTQINPHFLYNTLNYLYATAYPVSEPLAEAVLRLSDLMRYLLHDSPDGQVELSKEVEYLDNYLALHRLRFEEKFFVNFRQTGVPVGGQRVATLLLIPFVENALKHGVLTQAAHPVAIELALPTPNQLTFSVSNRISQHQKDATTGVGLPNIGRRLALLYPGRHTLSVHNDGQTYHTQLELHF